MAVDQPPDLPPFAVDQDGYQLSGHTNGAGSARTFGTWAANDIQEKVGEPPTLWAPDLAKAVEPIAFVCSELTIAPGRPTVFAGEGGTRKGWFAMALQLCGAAGLPLLGRYTFDTEVRSVYLDFEQTERVSRERFQLLARGHEIDLAGLEKRLGYRWKPVPSLAPRTETDRQRIVDELCWHTEGLQLAVVDSVRACSPGVEENSVFASGPLDIATEVSQRTGVAFTFLDHAGKPNEVSNGRTRKHTQRGHSSKLDAGQTLLVFSAEKGEPTFVTCERAQIVAETEWPEDFQFTLAAAHGGLQLQLVQGGPQFSTRPLEKAKAAVVTLLAKQKDLTSKEEIYRRINGSKPIKVEAVKELVHRKIITDVTGAWRLTTEVG